MERKDELVDRSVDQAKAIADDVKELAKTQAKLGAEEARKVLEPAGPALADAAMAAGLGIAGAAIFLLPILVTLGRQRALCALLGGAMMAGAAKLGKDALAELPPDFGERVRRMLRTDLATAVERVTAPTRH